MDTELIEGRLAELGFLKEIYENGEMKRIITPKGLEELRKMLKETKWQRRTIEITKEIIAENPEHKEEIVNNIRNALVRDMK